MSRTDHPLESSVKRRRFLGLGVFGIGALLSTGAFGWVFLRSLLPWILPGASRRVRVGLLSDIPVGVELNLESHKLFIKRDKQGIFALSTVCTHLGCAVRKNQSGFSCPCHGSRFDLDGQVLGGPAPKGLPWYRVRILPGERLEVDRSNVVQTGTKTRVS